MTAMQLTFDGREVAVAFTRARLGPVQREVMRRLGVEHSMRSVDAGRIAHERRGCGFGQKTHKGYSGIGCCEYASSDGSQVMKSLERRGFVVNIGGVWYLPSEQKGTQ